MKPETPAALFSNNKSYHLVSCGSDSIMRLFPSRRDESEAGSQWLERMLRRLSDQLPEENSLRQAIDVGLNQVEPERLWVLLNAPENISRAVFYQQASALLVQELGLNQDPSPSVGISLGLLSKAKINSSTPN